MFCALLTHASVAATLPHLTSSAPAVIPNMVTCGCDQEVAGKFGAAAGGSEAAASGNGGGGEKLGGRIRGGRSNTRHSGRGADGREEGAVFAAAADGGAVVSRALSDGGYALSLLHASMNDDFQGFLLVCVWCGCRCER